MKFFALATVLVLAAAGLAGCQSKPVKAEATAGEWLALSATDTTLAAAGISQSILASGVLDRTEQPPARLAVGRVLNGTSRTIDTELLTGKICRTLSESGQAVVVEKFSRTVPDLTLNGKIMETADGPNRRTFTFQFSLTSSQGLQVWNGEKEISKQIGSAGVTF